MEKPTSRPEAAAFEKADERQIPFREILFLAVPLASLMASETEPASFSCLVAMLAAFLLAFMTEEDAHEQTIDLRFLFLLGAALITLSVLKGRSAAFFGGWSGGTFSFALLRLALSFWLTWREGGRTDAPALPEKEGGCEESADHRIGYVPIFMLVVALYFGFGTGWAPFVFREASMAAEIAGELVDYCPWIFLLAIAFYLLMTSWEVFRVYNKKPIIYAFGGGDVLFLGLFAGHLGGGPLLALFFLSLIAQALIMGIRGVLKTNFFHIDDAPCKK